MVYVKVRWHGSTHCYGHRVIQDTNTPATFWQKTTANKRQLALSLIRENEIKYTICRTQSSVTRTHIDICDIKTTNVARTITESAMVQYSCVQIKKIFNTYIKYFTTTTTTTTSSLDLLLFSQFTSRTIMNYSDRCSSQSSTSISYCSFVFTKVLYA